jgi:hypothetical protein
MKNILFQTVNGAGAGFAVKITLDINLFDSLGGMHNAIPIDTVDETKAVTELVQDFLHSTLKEEFVI